MIILGIDPGSRATGYGLIKFEGNRLHHIDNGVIRPPAKADLAQRLLHIYQELQTVINQFHPDCSAIEQVFMGKNAQSALKLGQARGVAMLSAAAAKLDVAEYSPLQIKSAVVGYGRASKSQVQQMIKALLKLPEIAQEDASDALAVAICHAHTGTLTTRLTAQKQQRNRRVKQ
jgi:crossover junction endodeoxyribonuclease RuvC